MIGKEMEIKELISEAENKYPDDSFWIGSGETTRLYDPNKGRRDSFMMGATSIFVERRILQAQINENKSILSMLELHGTERIILPVKERIEKLEQELKQIQ